MRIGRRSTPAGKPMDVRFSRGLMLAWSSAETPLDEDWDKMLAGLSQAASASPAPLKLFVVTEGGSPTPSQQLRLARVVGGTQHPLAVVSEHIGVRFVASSIALFLKRIKTFRFDELTGAYDHLGLDDEQRALAAAFAREKQPAGRKSLEARA